jgi:hypothetical protein
MPPIVLILALLAPPADTPAELADRVASADPGGREEAEGRLEEIGRPALFALRNALNRAVDPASSRRIGDLIDLIERRRLLRATAVELVAKDVPIAEAAAELGRRTGFRLAPEPADEPAWKSRRVTLDSRGPIAFWEAVDRLGAAGGFRLDASSTWYGGAATEPTVRLVRTDDPPNKSCYAGPYRVDLVSLNRHRQVTQSRPGSAAKPIDEFAAGLQIVAEPGLVIDRNGPPRILEAIDDKGEDLRPASTYDPATRNAFSFRQWRPDMLGFLPYRVPLAIPASRGGTLKRLRGFLPISVVARTGPILSLPLEGTEGRPIHAGGITLTVRKVDRNQGRPSVMQLVVRGEAARATPATAPGPRQLTLSTLHPAYHPDDHIQILDAQGRAFSLSSNIPPVRPDGLLELTVTIHANSSIGPPATLRYYGLVGEATEVPFLFEDVPMP